MTREEALDAAEQEGHTLLRARNTTGFKYVVHHKNHGPRPFGLRITQDGHLLHLGTFATAEEAALQYARQYGRKVGRVRHTERAASLSPRHRERTELTAATAVAAAKREERFRCRRSELQDLQELLADGLLSEELYTAEVKRVLEKESPEHRARHGPLCSPPLPCPCAPGGRAGPRRHVAQEGIGRRRRPAAAAAAESTARLPPRSIPTMPGWGLQAGQHPMPPIQPLKLLDQQRAQSLQCNPAAPPWASSGRADG